METGRPGRPGDGSLLDLPGLPERPEFLPHPAHDNRTLSGMWDEPEVPWAEDNPFAPPETELGPPRGPVEGVDGVVPTSDFGKFVESLRLLWGEQPCQVAQFVLDGGTEELEVAFGIGGLLGVEERSVHGAQGDRMARKIGQTHQWPLLDEIFYLQTRRSSRRRHGYTIKQNCGAEGCRGPRGLSPYREESAGPSEPDLSRRRDFCERISACPYPFTRFSFRPESRRSCLSTL